MSEIRRVNLFEFSVREGEKGVALAVKVGGEVHGSLHSILQAATE